MMHWIEMVWWLSFSILMGYQLLVFRKRERITTVHEPDELPGVSIVIAVRNGSDRLIQHLQTFLSQDYPLYEIVVVDDHSEPDEKRKLEAAVSGHPNIFLYQADGLPGKKQALAIGIEKASHPIILCTDADCVPSGLMWIKSMVSHSHGNDVVIGFSPYIKSNGMLNRFIRFETVMTAIQYFSWALMGRPYMGVGRNMLYARQLFLDSNPFKDHESIPYGDDDLWIQQASRVAPVNVNLEESSFMYSHPAASWREWFRQKHRHLSAGHHYRMSSWWQPGVYGISLILHWFLVPFLLTSITQSDMLFFLLAGWMIRWITYIQWTQKLGERDTRIWYPLAEVAYAVYLAVVGVWTIVAKKKTWN
jgi:glycosyltransferase involved in cell wall biosynthesis